MTFLFAVSTPVISEHPHDANTTVYESVSFKCTARGFGKIKIVWKRVNHNMPETAVPTTEEKFLNKITGILKITKTVGYYSGQYYCVAESNRAGKSASQPANLYVQGNNQCT